MLMTWIGRLSCDVVGYKNSTFIVSQIINCPVTRSLSVFISRSYHSLNAIFSLLFLPDTEESRHFAVCLMNAFWNLHSCQPVNPVLSPLSSVGKDLL